MSEAHQHDRIEVALLSPTPAGLVAALQQHFAVHATFDEPDPLVAVAALGGRIRGAVTGGLAGLSRTQIAALPRLEICAINGVGLETTDLAACRERGITVTTAPVLFDDVADLALALALAACRRIAAGDRFVRSGAWEQERMPLGRRLSGRRAGIIGLGRIGTEVARRLEGFKAEIGYTDPAPRTVSYRAFPDGVALARWADLLFLCAAGGPKGAAAPIVDAAVLEALGPDGVFVNIARGWLVDEPALVASLRDRRLGAAGLDVFADEPHVPAPLLALDNVVLTPHVASATEETQRAMTECVVGNLRSWFAGRGALTPVSA
ncbi:MAG TPA: 2-hydroxyacid dehydrogenase [Acetobacteraceae bacterium]|nr:2-hydroxyacid dehydrogenase [Acetobacteraceae bacterium]